MTFGDKVIEFMERLAYEGAVLPTGIHVINPYRESGHVMDIARAFYHKYYGDNKPRHIILGINPGRFGAGVTGIPFTDPKRLVSECNISYNGKVTHEPSSVFVYEMINAYGGAGAFYNHFYINSVFPLALTKTADNGREKNYNYYDDKKLVAVLHDPIVENIRKQIALGIDTDICFCFGTGKNETFLRKLNEEYHFFKKIVALEHPRFIMQYKSANKDFYISKYLLAFKAIK